MLPLLMRQVWLNEIRNVNNKLSNDARAYMLFISKLTKGKRCIERVGT